MLHLAQVVDGAGARVLRASDLIRTHSAGASSEEVSQGGGHAARRPPSAGLIRTHSPASSEEALYKRHLLGGIPLPGQPPVLSEGVLTCYD
jgi:hypothetical protein